MKPKKALYKLQNTVDIKLLERCKQIIHEINFYKNGLHEILENY